MPDVASEELRIERLDQGKILHVLGLVCQHGAGANHQLREPFDDGLQGAFGEAGVLFADVGEVIAEPRAAEQFGFQPLAPRPGLPQALYSAIGLR